MAASDDLTNDWLAQDARMEEKQRKFIWEILVLTQKARESLRKLKAPTTDLFEESMQFLEQPFPASYVRAMSDTFDATPEPSGPTASAPTTLSQRTSFSVGQGADVRDVKLLSDDLVVVADCDYENKCLRLFTTEGQHLHSLGLDEGEPYLLAVINPAATDRWRVAVTVRYEIVIVEVWRGGIREVTSFQTQEWCRAIAAPDANTLAVGYIGTCGIDLLNMSGSVLRRLNGTLDPWHMVAAGDGRHIVMTTFDDTIAKVAVADCAVLFSSRVDQVKNPCGISLLAGGACVVSDAVNRSLHCVTPDGRCGGELWRHPGGGDSDDVLCCVSVCGSVCVAGTKRGTLFVLEV